MPEDIMCELFALSAREPATVTLSMDVFAKRGGLTGPHKDGWGIAYYDDGDITLVRDAAPANESPWVPFVAEQELQSRTVISHIRKATTGGVCLNNTQPFTRELGGVRHVFAHNGFFVGIEELFDPDKARFHPIGETDSEIGFCVLMERMAEIWREDTPPPPAERAALFRAFAGAVRDMGPANILYSDGEFLYAHANRRHQADGEIKPPGLHTLVRTCPFEDETLDDHGFTVDQGPGGPEQRVRLFASIPLTDEDWRPLDEGEVVIVGNGDEWDGG